MTPLRVRGPGGRAGFTVVEMLVGVAAAGVIGGALSALLVGQHRFYASSESGIATRQNVRVVIDLMAAELGEAAGVDLERATPDSVTIRFDVRRALVCDTAPGDRAFLFVFDSVANANVPRWPRGTAVSGPYDSSFVYADGFVPTVVTAGGTARSVCANLGAPTTSYPSSRFRTGIGWGAAYGRSPSPGSTVRSYGRLSYAWSPSTTHAGSIAIRRNGQELATPFEPGARFQYVMKDGSIADRVAGASLPRVRTIRVLARSGGPGVGRNVAPLVYDIPLRG